MTATITAESDLLPELTKQQKAKANAQKRRARKLPDEYLQCRLLGHQWNIIPNRRKPQFGDMLSLGCARCDSVREDIVSRRYGELLARNYDYPEGYLIKPEKRGERNFSAASLRAEVNRRLLDGILSIE